MLLLLISVIAPVVESNSMGMFTFLKNVSCRFVPVHSAVASAPLAAVKLRAYVLSIKVLNLDLFARLLND